ncbi:MAG: DNA topoisomerase IB [Actinomycetota bacterium]|nr:DNA topoisomerase IB [Actinomycetota bacterium]
MRLPSAVVDDDPGTLADLAGLRHVTPEDDDGFTRRRRGRGFSYHDASGELVPPEVRARIEEIVIPPAWSGVWIAAAPDAHIQATGFDDAGRRQYRYHDRWREVADERKFLRLGWFAPALDAVRATVARDLRAGACSEERVLAAVTRLIDRALIRVGHPGTASGTDDDGVVTYGATTLLADHLNVDGGRIELHFEAKGGTEIDLSLFDPTLAGALDDCLALRGDQLFSYACDDNHAHPVTADMVNDYIRDACRGPFTAKDFRTWGATVIAARVLIESDAGDRDPGGDPVLNAIDAAADQLGNTRAVCRASYVAPAVIDAHEDGSLARTWRSTRSGKRLSREERTVGRVLRTAADATLAATDAA